MRPSTLPSVTPDLKTRGVTVVRGLQAAKQAKNNHATADPTLSSDLAAGGNRLWTRTDHGLDILFGMRAHQPHTVRHIKIAKLAALVGVFVAGVRLAFMRGRVT